MSNKQWVIHVTTLYQRGNVTLANMSMMCYIVVVHCGTPTVPIVQAAKQVMDVETISHVEIVTTPIRVPPIRVQMFPRHVP